MMDLRWALEPSRLFNRPQLDHEFPVIETLQEFWSGKSGEKECNLVSC